VLSRRTFLRATGRALLLGSAVGFGWGWRWEGRARLQGGPDAEVHLLEVPADGPRPRPRRNATLVWDPIHEQVLLFGGRGLEGYLNDVWALRVDPQTLRGEWVPFEPADGEAPVPAPRRGHSAFFAPAPELGRMVIAFGQGGGFFHDVWAFDPGEGRWELWSPQGTEGAPPARYGSVLVYDAVGHRGVGFAGFTTAGRFDDAPAFSLETRRWAELTAPESPRPQRRCLHTGVYDPEGRRLVIFGGQRVGALDDTWALDPETGRWRELVPEEGERPPARFFAVSAYDPQGRRMLLTGGRGQAVYGDLWALDLAPGEEASWKPLRVEGPEATLRALVRHSAAGAFLPEARLWVLFGGQGLDGRDRDDLIALAFPV